MCCDWVLMQTIELLTRNYSKHMCNIQAMCNWSRSSTIVQLNSKLGYNIELGGVLKMHGNSQIAQMSPLVAYRYWFPVTAQPVHEGWGEGTLWWVVSERDIQQLMADRHQWPVYRKSIIIIARHSIDTFYIKLKRYVHLHTQIAATNGVQFVPELRSVMVLHWQTLRHCQDTVSAEIFNNSHMRSIHCSLQFCIRN